MIQELPWTGERLVAGCGAALVHEHLHRYALAVAIAQRKRVLDIACGEGYGANLLSRVAEKVVGVDIDAKTIEHASRKYRHRNLRFIQGSCDSIPLPDHSVDLIVSFETIEHVAEPSAFLSEIERVITPAGVLLISSPNRDEYSKIGAEPNPYHQAEVSHRDFVSVIRKRFKHCMFAGQRLVAGSWIGADASGANTRTITVSGDLKAVQLHRGVYRSLYSIAYASNSPLPRVPVGVLESHEQSAHVWNLLEKHGSAIGVGAALQQATQHAQTSGAELGTVRAILDEREKHIAVLQQENDTKTQQVLHYQAVAEERLRDIGLLQEENENNAQQLSQLKRETQECQNQVAALQQNVYERDQQVADLNATERLLSGQVADLKGRIHAMMEQLDTVATELNEAQCRGMLAEQQLRDREASDGALAESAAHLEAKLDAVTSQREKLRSIIVAMERDYHVALLECDSRVRLIAERELELTAVHTQLREMQRQLRQHRKRVARFAANVPGRLILPFGNSQRKLRRAIDDVRTTI